MLNAEFDLTADEIVRRRAFIEAADDFNPTQALADEQLAYSMLYSGLDDDQQATYDALVVAGVLPERVHGVPDRPAS